MSRPFSIAALVTVAVGVGLWLLSVPVAQGQVIHPDQMIAPQVSDRVAFPEIEPKTKDLPGTDLERGFERPMKVPDTETSGVLDLNALKTPDAADAEQARESDRQSAVSF